MKAAPEPFLTAIAPYREDVVVCVECLFTWYCLADLGAPEGMPCVLGHALSRNVIPGGKARHDKIDAHKIAVLLRGGLRPQADVYPTAMRATRHLLRRQMHLTRQRAELRAHIQQTNSRYNRPPIGTTLAYKANRDGVAERFPKPAVQKSIAVDLALIGHYGCLRTDLALELVQTGKAHVAQTFYRRRSLPGIGKSLALVLRDEIHAIQRFPRVQEFVSYGRLVKCVKESAGKRYGTRAPRSATPTSHGRSRQPPSCFCGTSRRAQTTARAWRTNMARAKP
jgi:transposase